MPGDTYLLKADIWAQIWSDLFIWSVWQEPRVTLLQLKIGGVWPYCACAEQQPAEWLTARSFARFIITSDKQNKKGKQYICMYIYIETFSYYYHVKKHTNTQLNPHIRCFDKSIDSPTKISDLLIKSLFRIRWKCT